MNGVYVRHVHAFKLLWSYVACLSTSCRSLTCCADANKPIWMHAEEIEDNKVSISLLTSQF